MQTWMISANGKLYDHASAFQNWGFIDWRQRARYSVGDIVYIYCTIPFMRVMYKTVVERESMASSEIVDDSEYWYEKEEYRKALAGKYARLRLVAQTDTDLLSLDALKKRGLNAAPQGPIKIGSDLAAYIDANIDEFRDDRVFPESNLPDNAYEGAKKEIVVNRYERSTIARQRCIDAHGIACFVCGFSFEKTYGEIGKGFIHIHHIVPLNQIGSSYKVNFKNDLIPVCPNCHAMLHRKKDGGVYTWQELKAIIAERQRLYSDD